MRHLYCFCLLIFQMTANAQDDDCYEKFFSRTETLSAPQKMQLIQSNGKITTLAAFLQANTIVDGIGFTPLSGSIDLDNDGKKEIVVYTYSGGAHCCDALYIFSYASPGKYKVAGTTFAGDVCINDRNEFTYNFYEQLGYFFTCFACAFEDTTDAGPIPVHSVVLKYRQGKLQVTPGDNELKAKITDNLAKLSEQPYEKLADESAQDNGLRKEFALNLAVYYYSFGRNMLAVQQLFNKYYHFPDAKKVWTSFASNLNGLRRSNGF
jgi:hypothetical protein